MSRVFILDHPLRQAGVQISLGRLNKEVDGEHYLDFKGYRIVATQLAGGYYFDCASSEDRIGMLYIGVLLNWGIGFTVFGE